MVLGVTTSVVVWTVLQVLLLAVALGVADYSTGRPGLVTPITYAVLTGGVAGLAVGSGAAITRRRLLAVDTDSRAARGVALIQCAVLVVLVGLLGTLTSHPSPFAIALLLSGATAGSWLGAVRGGRPPR